LISRKKLSCGFAEKEEDDYFPLPAGRVLFSSSAFKDAQLLARLLRLNPHKEAKNGRRRSAPADESAGHREVAGGVAQGVEGQGGLK